MSNKKTLQSAIDFFERRIKEEAHKDVHRPRRGLEEAKNILKSTDKVYYSRIGVKR